MKREVTIKFEITMRFYSFWLLSIGLWCILAQGNMDCVQSEDCDCFSYHNDIEYYCPPAPDDPAVTLVHSTAEKHVKIHCDGSITDLELLPDLDVGDLKYFSIRFCPLPTHGFNSALKQFNIGKIEHMRLEEMYPMDPEQTVNKGLLYGLSQMEKLSISWFGIGFDDNFLEYLPNLSVLYLDNNEIRDIDSNMFQYVPKLRVLDLSKNLISSLPDGLFENLSQLQVVYLWQNEVTALHKNSFKGLKQLKSLELSGNKIRYIDKNTFAELAELEDVSMRSNDLHVLPSNMFKHNVALQSVRFEENPNLYLTDYLFANLANLTSVSIDYTNFTTLPEHIFQGSTNLVEISFVSNNILEIFETVFQNMTSLKVLNLAGNRIKILPNNIFSSLTNLEILDLEYNELNGINEFVFGKLLSLQILNLRGNNLVIVHLHAFIGLKKLTELDLSFNSIDLNYGENEYGLSPFSHCEELQVLNLSHNAIDAFPENIMDSKINLRSLDLDYNNIDYVRVASLIKVSRNVVTVTMNSNNISTLDFREMKLYPLMMDENHRNRYAANSSTVLRLFDNPIRCDCMNFDFFEYINNNMDPVIKATVDIRAENLQCATPNTFKGTPVKQLTLSQITCPILDTGCPEECVCDYRPYDNHAVVNCSRRNLTYIPSINLREPINGKIEVNLEGNLLKTAPGSGSGYDNVTRLHLSNNWIKNVGWIPLQIEVLHLHGNQLKFLDSETLDSLNTSTTINNLTLYGNPWDCGCSATTLQNYLRNHFTKVKSTDVICEDDKLLVNKKELCKSRLRIILNISVPFLVILFVAASGTALYFRYQEPIKVWLYSKNLCLRFVTEEELDKDKTYDVFISYSHKDEDFVLQNLLPVLEQGPNPYKVCIHVRDWVPGEFITSSVTNSVLESRRTLVILSDNFLESVWGKLEFRTAHTQAINEGRARVIVVKYGKLNEQNLDEELKAYLETNTYVKWGDPWFWDKLKYALPHSRRNKFCNNNRESARIVFEIDDEFEVVVTPPTDRARKHSV